MPINSDPVDEIVGLTADDDTDDVEKGGTRAELKAVVRQFSTVDEVRNTRLAGRRAIMIGGRLYLKDTETTEADDGAAFVSDGDDVVWVRTGVTSFTPRGTWSVLTTYQIGDVVTYNDSSFVCIEEDNIGNIPAPASAQWQLLAQAGSPGGPISIQYTFSTTTADADPGNGLLRLDNATQNAATSIFADLLDNIGNTWTGVIDTFDDSTSTLKGLIRLAHQFDSETKFLLFSLAAVVTGTGYRKLTVSCIGYSGASPFANGDPLLLSFTRTGDKGDTGATGETGDAGAAGATGTAGADGSDPGILLTWDTGTTDADPGAGELRANNASLASATVLYISKTSRGGADIAAFLAALDASTNTAKGTLILTRPSDEAQSSFIVGAVTDASGYIKLAVSGHSGATSFTAADAISFQFSRAGDAGSAGISMGKAIAAAIVFG